MLTLITYPPQFDQTSASPFCVKAIYALNGAGLDWQREDTNDPRKMPMQKLPVLRTKDRLIAGSDQIARFACEAGTDIDAGLTTTEQAVSHALVRMAEEHLYFLLVLDRWERDDVWPTTRDAYFKDIPALLRGVISSGIRKTALRGLQSQGLGRISWPERLDRARADFTAISTQLGSGPFLFGTTPRLADASVAPILAAISATPIPTELQNVLAEFPGLRDYVGRVDAGFSNAALPR